LPLLSSPLPLLSPLVLINSPQLFIYFYHYIPHAYLRLGLYISRHYCFHDCYQLFLSHCCSFHTYAFSGWSIFYIWKIVFGLCCVILSK
jgi:hypothetical protein